MNKHPLLVAVIGAALAIGSPAAAENDPPAADRETPAAEAGPEKDPSAADPEAPAADAGPTATEEETAEALVSQPQVTAIRGGTLGIPSAKTAAGLQAAFDAKAGGATNTEGDADMSKVDTTSLDFYTKLGRLNLTNQAEVEVIVDQFQMDLPRLTVGTAGGFPLVKTTELTSFGIRISFRTTPVETEVFEVSTDSAALRDGEAAADREAHQTLTKLFEKTSKWEVSAGVRVARREAGATELEDFQLGGAFELMAQYSMNRKPAVDKTCEGAKTAAMKAAEKTLADAEAAKTMAKADSETARRQVEHLVREDMRDATIETLLAGDPAQDLAKASTKASENVATAERRLIAADTAVTDATSQKAEVESVTCPKRVDISVTAYGSVSGTYLEEELRSIDGAMVLFPRWKEVRLTVGVDLQTSKIVTGSKLLPRLGAYASLAWGFWTNEFGEPEQVDKIRARQWQAAVYTSGHVFKGVSGLLSLGVLSPYGHDSHPAFVVSFAPAYTSGGTP